MKLLYLLITVAILASCGGGGGVMDMSTPTPPVVDNSAAMQLAADLAAARTAIANSADIPPETRTALESRIDKLEQSLQNAEAVVAELRMSLEEILQKIQNIKSPPVDDSPTAAECHAQSQILVGDNCQGCPTNMQFSVNQCVEIPPTAASCHADNQILVGDNCQSCPPNMQFSINQCIPTAASCHADNQILVGDNCQSCPPNMQFSINQCIPTAASCHADNQILVGDNCQSCPPNMQFSVNQCIPTAESCHAQSQILIGDSCQRCPTNRDFINNRCVSIFDTAEYQVNLAYESIKPLYAYERGYSGQGVTVAIFEHRANYLIHHSDLAPNYITTSIDGISDYRLEHHELSSGAHIARDNFHAAGVAGLLGARRNGEGMHGIAPEVKMIPFWAAPSGYIDGVSIPDHRRRVLQYLGDNNIPIINNSYGSCCGRPVSVLLTSRYKNAARSINEDIGDTQAIWVWAAGNERESINAEPQALIPYFYPRLSTLWLAAVQFNRLPNGVHRQSTRSICGDAKYWCVGAALHRVHGVRTTYENEEGESIRNFHGTSAAAPLVSGALAILYGAIGMDSPQLARAILLTTATDLGDEGVDDIYGWGLVNISAGIQMIENMEMEKTEELSAVSFADLRGELPYGFAHLHNELSAIKLAIKLTTDLYYNVALSEMLTPGNPKAPPLGDAAAEMLENRGEETRRGIFAYGDINTELGLRYYGGTGGFNYIAEGNQSATNNFSGNFGGIGGISGKTYGGKLGFTKAIKANMQIFADYERAKIIGKGEEGNLIKGARNARAESWAAGISFADIWKYGDKIRLSANQEMKLSGGELIIRYPHAVGDFHKTFTGEETQNIEIRETFLPLKQKAIMRYTAGYAQKINKKSEWATALEYNAGNNAKAISLIWQGEF